MLGEPLIAALLVFGFCRCSFVLVGVCPGLTENHFLFDPPPRRESLLTTEFESNLLNLRYQTPLVVFRLVAVYHSHLRTTLVFICLHNASYKYNGFPDVIFLSPTPFLCSPSGSRIRAEVQSTG